MQKYRFWKFDSCAVLTNRRWYSSAILAIAYVAVDRYQIVASSDINDR